MQSQLETHPILFKRDTTGRVRIWRMERAGAQHRVISGLQDGAHTESGWTQCVGKQGRTDEEQAQFEIAANYKHQLDREYHETVDTIDQPKFFKPMLAQKYDGFPGPCFAQPKLDGIRCIVTNAGMFSREGKPILGAPHVRRDLNSFFAANPAAILDGELYNHDLKDDFNTIVSAVKKQNPTPEQLALSEKLVQYHIYDYPSPSGDAFEFRDQTLDQLFADGWSKTSIRLVETHVFKTAEDLDEYYGDLLEAGYEGQMVRLNAPYEQKRSKTLLKRKEFIDEEFECVAIEEGLGNWAGFAKRVVCKLPDGRTFGAGIKGNQARAKELLSETHKVVTVKYFARTPDGIPRFPVVTQFHGAERVL